MRELAVGLALLFAVLLQVTAAPLFSLSGSIPDLALLTLATIAVFLGPRWAMVCMPIAALFLGFLTSHEPAVFILAYLPMLPLAAWLAATAPLTRFLQTAITVGATGLWARTLLSVGAMASGAAVDVGGLVGWVLLPGLFLDLALLTVAYPTFRVIGWEPKSLALRADGYFSS